MAVAAVAVAFAIGPYVPGAVADKFGGDATDQILTLLSSSMLVITTFSLGTMVSAHNSAASNATPRAAPLLVEDNYAQNALSTFVGVFVYSVISLVALDAGVYGGGERTVLFGVTASVLVIVVITLIRWIDELTQLGQMHDTLSMIESATVAAIDSQIQSPCSCGISFEGLPTGLDVPAGEVGYIQTIDFEAIDQIVGNTSARVYLQCQPGTFTHRHKPLCRIVGVTDEQARGMQEPILNAFVLGPRRTMLQDPRYGLLILSEVAARALSPGVNDPATAIDVIVVGMRTIDHWDQQWTAARQPDAPGKAVHYGWLYSNPIDMTELLRSCYDAIIRYGAGQYPVMARLLRALQAVRALNHDYDIPAQDMARHAMERARVGVEDKRELRALENDYVKLFGEPK